MSYCRFGADSDIYLIAHVNGGWVCYCDKMVSLDSPEDVEAHLLNHRRRGDKVPEYALARIRSEMAPNIHYSERNGE